MTLPGHDARRLDGPEDYGGDAVGIGPDEDTPRGFRPRPCGGLMMAQDGEIVCERCGSRAWRPKRASITSQKPSPADTRHL